MQHGPAHLTNVAQEASDLRGDGWWCMKLRTRRGHGQRVTEKRKREPRGRPHAVVHVVGTQPDGSEVYPRADASGRDRSACSPTGSPALEQGIHERRFVTPGVLDPQQPR